MASIPKLPKIQDDDPLLRRVLYAGEKSATADKEALAEAKRRIEAGEDASKVWTDTGWKQGANGKWRSEIPDAESKLRPGVAQRLQTLLQNRQSEQQTLGELLDHPELEKAYPEMMNMPVRLWSNPASGKGTHGGVSMGAYYGGKIQLNLEGLQQVATREGRSLEDKVREVLLHEGQHHIQRLENWKSPRSAGGKPAEAYEAYRAHPDEAEAFDAGARRDLGPRERRSVQPGALEARETDSRAERRVRGVLFGNTTIPGRADAESEPEASFPAVRSALTPDDFREAYAAHHGFPDYLSMHFQLLHPSTPPDVAEHHLQAAWGTPDGAIDNESGSAP